MRDITTPPQTLWNASLSTMWAIGNENLAAFADFVAASQQLGFARIELNHRVDSAMLAAIHPVPGMVSSIHEPCPADISVTSLKSQDWLISATDEQCREQGVRAVQRSIALARSLGVPAVVVHAGAVRSDWPLEKELYDLYRSGQMDTPKYQEVKNRLVENRAALVGPRLEAVQKSLAELLEVARAAGIRLGLENRYHYMDIPVLEEMDLLLQMAGPEELGFWYDVGHAQALDRLGFDAQDEWLERFAGRITGVHLHDIVGITDHRAPGTGEVDFARIAGYLPADTIHTCEVSKSVPLEQVRAGLQYLVDKGCVNHSKRL